jgi:hypothetical protein
VHGFLIQRVGAQSIERVDEVLHLLAEPQGMKRRDRRGRNGLLRDVQGRNYRFLRRG